MKQRLDFTHRAHLSEWMDEPCSYQEFRDCLRDLERVNRITAAYRPTLQWLQRFAGAQQSLHIVDVGCGGGDMLRKVHAWAHRRGIRIRLTGIDLNPYAARAAREFSRGEPIEFITGDAFAYMPDVPVDIVISSLFSHHLPDAEIVRFLSWMERTAQRGWFINDLHREPMLYFGFALLARIMRWHRFVQHDGPVSIRRAFRHHDWARYLEQAGIPRDHVSVFTMRPARLCVSRVKV